MLHLLSDFKQRVGCTEFATQLLIEPVLDILKLSAGSVRRLEDVLLYKSKKYQCSGSSISAIAMAGKIVQAMKFENQFLYFKSFIQEKHQKCIKKGAIKVHFL